jgi:hypothetical protein
LLIAGQFGAVGNIARAGIARLSADGTLDTAFGAEIGFGSGVFPAPRNVESLVSDMAVGSDGSIVVGGAFATFNNQVRLGVARFQGDGGDPGGGSGAGLSGLTRSQSGAVSMLISGEAGRTYRIEASTDLRTWTVLGTVTAAAGPQPFNDSAATSLPQRFYRAIASQ